MSVRRLAAALVAASSMTAIGAFAAGSSVASDTIASGSASVARCDANTAAWAISFTTNTNGMADTVTVANIAETCENGTLSLALTGESGVVFQGTKAVTSTDCPGTTCSAVLAIAQPLEPSSVTAATVIIEGGQ